MIDDKNLHDDAEAIREETAADAPELAEHDRVAELERQLEEAKNKALYAAADTQNVRRRLEAEKQQASTYAVTGFARDMLSVRDHLDRALSHVPEAARADEKLKSFVEGIETTLREIDSIFGRNGIERVAAKGLPLDPNRHQAMIEVATDQAEPGTIVEEMQSGYVLKDRLLRPALVSVAKAG
ncbi:nucleotide exchange factor GrpE [Sphingomonas sp. LY29]|uniref:nucleotide exchange factor GrpE n=1 Tax=unclassified Sphingomonas TaxID=196159 RepID=UPI002ADEC62F|nr:MULTISPECIES: nucleotide exchange factor GrpE [unclassified Sphingomonas]MEA1071539.1 nucleotide exchange factor GrpE [Sphingomonas sp. LY160]WRP25783.1 nucleotide exchange factor GrpE [Sphingomonas sp. LY29]